MKHIYEYIYNQHFIPEIKNFFKHLSSEITLEVHPVNIYVCNICKKKKKPSPENNTALHSHKHCRPFTVVGIRFSDFDNKS